MLVGHFHAEQGQRQDACLNIIWGRTYPTACQALCSPRKIGASSFCRFVAEDLSPTGSQRLPLETGCCQEAFRNAPLKD